MDTKGTLTNVNPEIRGKVKVLPFVDATLEKGGYSADAKAVGDALKNHMKLIRELQEEIKALKGEGNDVI